MQEYRVQASLIRAVNDSKQQDEDDGEQEDNNQSSNQQSNYNQGNGASRAGEVTGIVLRKTGKTLSAFGENMLKNLLAEDEPQKRSDHSVSSHKIPLLLHSFGHNMWVHIHIFNMSTII